MHRWKHSTLAASVAICLALSSTALLAAEPQLFLTEASTESPERIATEYLHSAPAQYGLARTDLDGAVLSDTSYVTKHTGVHHMFFDQYVNGIPVYKSVFQVNVLPDGRVLNASSTFVGDAHKKARATTPKLSAAQALQRAAADLGVAQFQIQKQADATFAGGTLSAADIEPNLVYQPHNGELRLAWQFVVDRFETHSELLDMRYDAITGEQLETENYVNEAGNGSKSKIATPAAAGHVVEYRVSPLGQESPTHPGVGHALVTDPHEEVASPYGWHDTRTSPAAGQPEYIVTRGNNVRAQWDLLGSNNGSNTDNNRPHGVWDPATNTLSFDFPWIPTEAPDSDTNRVAATVNLFYWNNIIHDVMYQYGFDEPSGNFQFNNYGRGGSQNDGVIADALDGSMAATPSVNNANFSTPIDGSSGRMQMFRWTAPAAFEVLEPYQEMYTALLAGFGGDVITGNSNEIVPADDGTAKPLEGCETGTWANAAEVNGKIALIIRGSCEFGAKALNAQNNGAAAAIIYNNVNDEPISMGGGAAGPQVTIPVISLGLSAGEAIRAAAETDAVEGMFHGPQAADRDSDFDAGIIAHEYGHGVSIRLTGGPSRNCLSGDEQQGEGWSDFFALHFTMTDNVCEQPRGVGTYTSFQDTTGPGIRRYPYTPDMSINPFTYADIADEAQSVPHGVGSVWATMLWDMSCKLMDRYGYEPDIYSRGGGNGLAMQLVTDGLKLQGCTPDFVSSRDAIIAADAAMAAVADTEYESLRCVIWHSFARRGVGVDADAGSYRYRDDQTEDFEVPADCISFDVQVDVTGPGTVTTADALPADYDTVLSFDVTPDSEDARLVSIEGCEGTLVDDTFITKPMVRNCTITAVFENVTIFADGFEELSTP